MANKYVERDEAPFKEKLWKVLDQAMEDVARRELVGRRLLHVKGPFGLGFKTVSLGDVEAQPGVSYSLTLPLFYIYKTFTLNLRDIAAYEKQGVILDTSSVVRATLECARMEDQVLFKGSADVPGLITAKGVSSSKLSSWEEVGKAADDVITAVTELDKKGFHGPYTLAFPLSGIIYCSGDTPRGI